MDPSNKINLPLFTTYFLIFVLFLNSHSFISKISSEEKNIKNNSDNSEYQIYEYYTQLFYLKDPLQSFAPSNREIFREFGYGPTQTQEQELINPCGLKQWFIDNPEKTFYEITEKHDEENLKLIGTDLQRQDLINFNVTTQQMIDFVCNQFNTAEKHFTMDFLDLFNQKDPDSEYISQVLYLINKNFQERHQLEKELPMMYEQRKTRKAFGCIHTLTNCLLWCDKCKKYYICPRCHDDEVFTHQFEYKNIQKCKCLKCNTIQQPREKCINCGTIFASNWCEKCRILRIVDNQSTPVFHCQKHDVCHYNTHPDFSFCCDTCKCCFPNDNKKYHDCNGTFCCMCQGQILKEDDVVFCKQSKKHIFHQYCFQELYDESEDNVLKCPICKTIQYDYETIKFLQLRNMQSIRCHYGLKIFIDDEKHIGLYYQQCENCHQNSISTCGGICPICFYKCPSSMEIFDFRQIQQYLKNQIKYDQITNSNLQLQQQFEEFRERINQQKDLYKSARLLFQLDKGDTFYYTDRVLVKITRYKDFTQQNIDTFLSQMPYLGKAIDNDDIMTYVSQYQNMGIEEIDNFFNNIEEENSVEEFYEETPNSD